MKLLYQMAATGKALKEACEGFGEYTEAPAGVRDFALSLLKGVIEKKDEIDARIREVLKNWEFERLALVDLQLLRIGVYELLFCEDLAANIIIDEAIEISKEYSTGDSYRFVNGVLGALCSKYVPHRALKRPPIPA